MLLRSRATDATARTLTISEARAYALRDGGEHLIATMTGTLMAMVRREPASPSEQAPAPA